MPCITDDDDAIIADSSNTYLRKNSAEKPYRRSHKINFSQYSESVFMFSAQL